MLPEKQPSGRRKKSPNGYSGGINPVPDTSNGVIEVSVRDEVKNSLSISTLQKKARTKRANQRIPVVVMVMSRNPAHSLLTASR